MTKGNGIRMARVSGSPRSQVAWAVVLIAIVTGGVVAFAVVVAGAAWPEGFSPSAFESLIRSWGGWGVAASIGLMVVHTFIPFPAEFVAIANGMIYGPLWGTVITWTGAMLGAFVAFGLAKALGRPFVERLVARRDWRRADEVLSRQGTAAVFAGRFIPVISFNLINWAAGLTGMSWWTFTWATGLGILPVTILMAHLGANMETLPWWGWLIALILALALSLAGRWFYRRMSR